jgi:hypothetical protein
MKYTRYLLSMLMVAFSTIAFIACDDDEEAETLPPTLSFTDTDKASEGQRGQTVTIELSVLAQGGLQSVTANGTPVTITAGSSTQQTVTFDYTIAADAPLGAIPIEFVVTDQRNRTATNTYTVTVVGSTVEVTADITANTTWEEGNTYVLTRTINIIGGTLTIKKGARVLAVDDGKPVQDATKVLVALRVEPTGRLVAEGEANAPIVFSVQSSGTPQPGMWRGLIIKGDPAAANHNAGTLRYVRVEYGGGDEDDPTDDKGALTFVNVGISTVVEFVQVFRSLGQGFRTEGSTIAFKNCIGTENLKSNLQLRHTGTSAADVKHSNVYLQNFISNNATINKDTRDFLISNPPSGTNGGSITAANVTLIGPGATFSVGGSPSSADGMRAETRAGKVAIYNSIVAEFPEDGIRLSNNDANSRIEYSYFFRIGGTDATGIPALGNSTALRENAVQFADAAFNNNINPTTTTIAGIGPNDYTPNASQASTYDPTALNDANFTFAANQYVGAIGTTDWTTGGWARNADGSIRQ